jgi:HK97 family phage portal protein
MQTFDLSSKQHTSRVLDSWLSEREGGHVRAGIVALGENSANNNVTADQLASMLGASVGTAAGINVTPDLALRETTVYGCVALIAGAISTLPLPVYERTEDTRKRSKHDYWWMLNEQAYGEMTVATAMEYFVTSRLFYGDAFAKLIRPNPYTNRVVGWQPLHPNCVMPFRNSDNRLLYQVTEFGVTRVYDPADIIHVPSLGFNGLRSPSPITYAAREAIGNSLAAGRFNGQFFSQGSTHDIALKAKGNLTKEQADGLRASYLARQAGSRGPLVLHGGLEVEKLSITPADAALLPTRQFTVEEICRVFGVPPFMIGATDKTTSWGSGIEQQGIAFVKYTLRRHLTPIEQEFNRKLWPSREKYFVEYNTAALERGDFKTRMEGYRIAIGRAGEPGWMKPNEARHLENMEPVAGGNQLHTGAPPAQSGNEPAPKDPK